MEFTKLTPSKFNIAYGESEPSDISKLWVKTTEPTSVRVSYTLDLPVPTLTNGTACGANCTQYPYVYYNKKVYLFGGKGSAKAVDIKCYDTETHTSTTLTTSLPVYMSKCSVALVGTKVYIFGGANQTTNTSATPYDTIYCFDIETETLTTLDVVLPVATFDMKCAVIESKVYLIGGKVKNSSNWLMNTNVYCFDTANSSISIIGTLNISVTGFSYYTDEFSCVVGTKIYIFSNNYFYCYDTTTNNATVLSTPVHIQEAETCAFYYDGYLYPLAHDNQDYLMRRYNIMTDEWEPTLYLTDSSMKKFYWTLLYSEENKAYLLSPSTECEFIVHPHIVESNTLLICPSADGKNRFNLIDTDDLQIETTVRAVYKGNENGEGERVEACIFDREKYEWVTI